MSGVITSQDELYLNMHKREWWSTRPTKADRSDKVTITYPRSSQRFMTYIEVKGEREMVLDHVAYLVHRHQPHFMYEHMALQVTKVVEVGDDTVALLSQWHYAGD